MVKYKVTVLTNRMNFDGSHLEEVHEKVVDILFPAGVLFLTFEDGTKKAYSATRWLEVEVDKPVAKS